MSLGTFTLLHVLISLAGIGSGILVLVGFLKNRRPIRGDDLPRYD